MLYREVLHSISILLLIRFEAIHVLVEVLGNFGTLAFKRRESGAFDVTHVLENFCPLSALT